MTTHIAALLAFGGAITPYGVRRLVGAPVRLRRAGVILRGPESRERFAAEVMPAVRREIRSSAGAAAD